MPTITLTNLRKETPSSGVKTDFYCDRRSPVGNPFHMDARHTRDDVCDQYEEYFAERMVGKEPRDIEFQEFVHTMGYELAQGKDIKLLCWCVPLRCHTETIKKYLISQM